MIIRPTSVAAINAGLVTNMIASNTNRAFASSWLSAVALLTSTFATLACGQSPTAPSQVGPQAAGSPVQLNLEQSSANFTFRYSERSAEVVSGYLAELETNLPRVLANLDVTLSERIVVRLYPDRATLEAATGLAGTGQALGRNLMFLAVSPTALSDAVHEMAHVVTWQLSPPDFSTTWLWEAIAVHEARSFVHPAHIASLVAGRFPTLAQLNNLNNQPRIYEVGYTIMELIIEEWGWRAVRQLVVSRGDLAATLGLTSAEFEGRWRRFVEQRYLSGVTTPRARLASVDRGTTGR